MGKLSRTKGHNFEREIARQYREALPHDADEIVRGQQGSGAVEPDVRVPGLWVECYHGKEPLRRARLRKLSQALRDCDTGRVPVAVTREHGTRRDDVYATLTLGDLADLVAELDVYETGAAGRPHGVYGIGIGKAAVTLSHDAWLVLWAALDARRRG